MIKLTLNFQVSLDTLKRLRCDAKANTFSIGRKGTYYHTHIRCLCAIPCELHQTVKIVGSTPTDNSLNITTPLDSTIALRIGAALTTSSRGIYVSRCYGAKIGVMKESDSV
jgi:hypothetical protein